MPSILTSIAEASHVIVEADGVRWRVRRMTARALLDAGIALLPVAAEAVAPNGPKDESEPTIATMIAGMIQQRDLAPVVDAAVCAAVDGVGPAEGDIDAARLVLDERDEDTEAGRMWVERLPLALRAQLFAAAQSLAREGLGESLARFRGGR